MSSRRLWFLLIAFAAALPYLQTLNAGFVTLDDPLLVTENPIVVQPSAGSVATAFSSYDPELYIPVTLVSYQAETLLFGMHAWHFHAINIALHIGSALLLFSLLRLLTGSSAIAGMCALLFAVHPINAEAVSWVSARKDLLAGFFFLASWRVYLSQKNYRWAAPLSLLLFAAALGAKVSAVTLPFVLLLIEWKRGDRTQNMFKKMMPYFGLALGFGIVALFGKTAVIGGEHPLAFVFMAVRSTAFYTWKILWPTHLSPFYPIAKDLHLLEPVFLLSVATCIGLVAAAWVCRRHARWITFGIFFFVLTLLPTFAHYSRGKDYFMLGSERYAYIPAIGLFLAIAVVAHTLLITLRSTQRTVASALGCIIVCVMAWLSLQHSAHWHDGVTFNRHILSLYPGDGPTHYNLAISYEQQGKTSEAMQSYRESIQLNPTKANPYINLAVLLASEGNNEDALQLLTQAVIVEPQYFKAHYNLAVLLEKMHRDTEAIGEYEQTIALYPEYIDARLSLARLYGSISRFADALAQYEEIATLNPAFAEKLAQLRTSMQKNQRSPF